MRPIRSRPRSPRGSYRSSRSQGTGAALRAGRHARPGGHRLHGPHRVPVGQPRGDRLVARRHLGPEPGPLRGDLRAASASRSPTSRSSVRGPAINEALIGGSLDVANYADTAGVLGKTAGADTSLVADRRPVHQGLARRPRGIGHPDGRRPRRASKVATIKATFPHRFLLVGPRRQRARARTTSSSSTCPCPDSEAALDAGPDRCGRDPRQRRAPPARSRLSADRLDDRRLEPRASACSRRPTRSSPPIRRSSRPTSPRATARSRGPRPTRDEATQVLADSLQLDASSRHSSPIPGLRLPVRR